MASLTEIGEGLEDLLANDDWAGIDASVNGIQVENSGEIEKAAFAVDASVETIDEAASRDADLLVVHHGIVWGSIERLTGQGYDRFRRLVENDIALYVSHLPLDAHGEIGNNAVLIRELGGSPDEGFGEIGGRDVGYVGELDEGVGFEEFVERVESVTGFDPDVLGFGDDKVERVAVLTGAGGGHIDEAADVDADVFVSGEPKHRAYHDAKEHGVNAVFAGHYHTETFGVRELQRVVEEEFGVATTFIDAPTSV